MRKQRHRRAPDTEYERIARGRFNLEELYTFYERAGRYQFDAGADQASADFRAFNETLDEALDSERPRLSV